MLDCSVLNEIKASYELEGEMLVSQIVEIFLADAPLLMKNLKQAAYSNRSENAASAAHSLKGSCVCIGAQRLVFLCEQFELSSPSLGGGAALAMVGAMEAELDDVCEELQIKFAAPNPHPGSTGDLFLPPGVILGGRQ